MFVIYLVLFNVIIIPASNATTSESLTYYTEIYPPSNFLENNELVGLSVETLKLLWQKMNVKEQKIHIVPWARGYHNVLNKPNSMLFTMARTPKRETLFKWVGPLYFAEHVLIAKHDFTDDINDITDAYQYIIAAIKNDVSEITLLEKNFPDEHIVRISQLRQAILMLQNKRIDLMIVSRTSLKGILDEHNLTMDDIKIVFSINKIGNYYAFNVNTPDILIEQYQQAFDQIKEERQKINYKYGVFQ